MAKGYSLHIGLDRVDARCYNGWEGRLNTCEADAIAMANIARFCGYQKVQTLLTSEATKHRFKTCLDQYINKLKKEDILLLTFSGHGNIAEDDNGDECDGKDEQWCLFDGVIRDDFLFYKWNQLPPDIRVLIVSDSCYSGGMIKPILFSKSLGLTNLCRRREKNGRLDATIFLLAACREPEVAKAGKTYSQFTQNLLQVWNNGEFDGNYKSFISKVKNKMPAFQSPQFIQLGQMNEMFYKSTPFRVV